MQYALCFPGQGSQEVGMGKELYEAFSSARDVFAEADDALSFNLTRLIFEGPEHELRLTANAQPAILTTSMAVFRVLEKEMGVTFAPSCSAGHSLGEYTALAAAGVLSLHDAVQLVNKRGQWMQESAPEGVGAMAALLGIDAEKVVAICESVAPDRECQAANFNSPGQVVISGYAEFVDKAIAQAMEQGAKKAVMLHVSAPFHSKLMMGAADKLKEQFNVYQWSDAKWPVVCNVNALPISAQADIRKALYEQTYSPVQWMNSVLRMADDGVDTFLELGPGDVLCGLIKRCRKGMHVMSSGTLEKIENIASVLVEAGSRQ